MNVSKFNDKRVKEDVNAQSQRKKLMADKIFVCVHLSCLPRFVS